MWVTCYCDASFNPITKKASYACWIKTFLGKKEIEGICPDWVTDNNLAELFAIYTGVRYALKVWNTRVIGVVVCSDSEEAIRLTWPWTAKHRLENFAKIQTDLDALRTQYGIEIRTKHIKGHQALQGSKQKYVNRLVDKKAGKALKKVK